MQIKDMFLNVVRKQLEKLGLTVSRSRFHEEESIDLRRIFVGLLGLKERAPCVIQVGANDGFANDPIRDSVCKMKWELLALEPIPTAYERLSQNYSEYPNVRCVNAALGTEDGEATLYTVKGSDDQLASFSIDQVRKHRSKVKDLEKRLVTLKVKQISYPSLVVLNGKEPDLLQIDVEGFDFEVVKMALRQISHPPVIAFEWAHLTKNDMWDCRCLLIEHGYKWVLSKGDVICVKASILRQAGML